MISDKIEVNPLPVIVELDVDKIFPFSVELEDEIEGPYKSLFQLKNESTIFNKIIKQKHRDRILKSKNIEKLDDIVVYEKDKSYTSDFRVAFNHITVGKIYKGDVKGVHFFNPSRVKIIEIVKYDEKTKVYSAKISKLDLEKDIWIEKKSLSNFFPDEWTLSELNYELDYAFNNKKKFSENIYKGVTNQGIIVKFIIKNEKIITIYPEL